MLTGARLDAAIRRLSSRPSRGTYFRAMLLAFAADPLGKRRQIVGGRFNVARGTRVLYLADDQVTALHEAQAFGFPAKAVAIVPVECELCAVVDLRDPSTQELLQTDDAELSENFRARPPGSIRSPTQSLGEKIAASLAIDGLIYDSPARPGHANLAVIEAALRVLGSSVRVKGSRKRAESLP